MNHDLATHAEAPFSGVWSFFLYLLYGNGHWTTRLQCTHDVFLCVFSVVGFVWMAYWYWRHVAECKKVFGGKYDPLSVGKLWESRVFLLCLAIQFVHQVASWVIPLYYISAILTLISALYVRELVKSNLQAMTVQQLEVVEKKASKSKKRAELTEETIQHVDAILRQHNEMQEAASVMSTARTCIALAMSRLENGTTDCENVPAEGRADD